MVIETFRVVKVLSLGECWRYVCESVGGVFVKALAEFRPSLTKT